ncbi:MAG TPA: carbamoyltransferase [Gemmatimonadaceae bacterium]|nr:carbamoyltransferase [Gemmatimonadaceae bacterium]
MKVLGISAYYHDSAAALIDDGVIVAAAQEERWTRHRHDPGFPRQAIAYCLRDSGTKARDIDCVAYYEKPFLKFERLIETYLAYAPRGFGSFIRAMPVWLRDKLFLRSLLTHELRALDPDVDWSARLAFPEHHASHAASAFFPSPFEEAAILTVDGVGEWATTSIAMGRRPSLDIVRQIDFPHSLGLLYSAFTYYLGFRVNSAEYKVMGLAPYGEPRYASLIRDRLIDLKDDGSFRLDLSYFDYCAGSRMTNDRFHALFGAPPRGADQPISSQHRDLAASIQAVLDDAMLRMTRDIATRTGATHLCLAGGVALNCVANGAIHRDGRFEGLWIQPAAGDAGGAIGAAYIAWQAANERAIPTGDSMRGALLGPEFSQAEIEQRLGHLGARWTTLSDEALIACSVERLVQRDALGWFQGRMEFGPRALGSRSILADPRDPTAQSTLNLKVKFRESFRPFAPAVLRERAAEWFELDVESPYMLLVAQVRDQHRSEIPAVTHVDGSARLQTVDRAVHPRFHALIAAFAERTGCPMLVNTSFNVRGEPIVCTPDDAFRCFMATGLDAMSIGNCFLRKVDQTAAPDPATFLPD